MIGAEKEKAILDIKNKLKDLLNAIKEFEENLQAKLTLRFSSAHKILLESITSKPLKILVTLPTDLDQAHLNDKNQKLPFYSFLEKDILSYLKTTKDIERISGNSNAFYIVIEECESKKRTMMWTSSFQRHCFLMPCLTSSVKKNRVLDS